MKARITGLILLLFTISIISDSHPIVMSQGKTQEKNIADSPELSEALRLSALVVELYGQRKYDESLPLAKKALQLREKVLGKDDEPVVDAVINLAEVQYARRMLVESKNLFERALASLERTGGVNHPRRAAIMERLGRICEAEEKPKEAELLFRQSLEIREKNFGPQDRETARSVKNLAEFYQFVRDYDQAEPLYQRLIAIQLKAADEEFVAQARRRYACLLRKTNRKEEADRMEEGLFAPQSEKQGEQSIDQGIVNGKATYLALPRYPVEARKDRLSGHVRVKILISEQGDVISACGIEGPQKLLGAAEAAAVVSKFSPTTTQGKPIRVTGVIIYNFVAQ